MPILKPVRECAARVLCKLEVFEPNNGGGAHVALFPPGGRRSSEGNATALKLGRTEERTLRARQTDISNGSGCAITEFEREVSRTAMGSVPHCKTKCPATPSGIATTKPRYTPIAKPRVRLKPHPFLQVEFAAAQLALEPQGGY